MDKHSNKQPNSLPKPTLPSLLPQVLSVHIFNNLPDVVIVADLKGSVQFMNQTALDLVGYTPAQVVGQPATRFFVGDEAAFFKDPGLTELMNQGVAPEVEMLLLTRDAKRTRLVFDGSLARDVEGRAVAVVGIAPAHRLARQLPREAQARAILYRASQEIAASLDPEQVCAATHRAVAQLMPSEAFVIALLDDTWQEVELLYSVEQGQRMPIQRFPAHRGLSGHIIASGETLCVDDVGQVDDIDLIHVGEFGYVRSLLAVPMQLGDRVVGMLSTQSAQRYAYIPDDQQMLSLLANQAIIALENARLFAQVTETLARERRLNEIARTISSALDLPSLLQDVTHLVSELIGADMGVAVLFTPDTGTPDEVCLFKIPRDTFPPTPPRGQGLMWQSLESGRSLLLSDYSAHPQAISHLVAAGARSFIGIPILSGVQPVGGMGLFSTDPQKRFDERDLALAESVGRQAGAVIQNVRLFQTRQRQLEELIVLHAVATAGAEATSEDELIERATKVIGETLYPNNFGILILDESVGVLRIHPSYRAHEEMKRMTISMGKGITGQVAASGKALRVPDVTRAPGYISADEQTRSKLCVPLRVGERVIGVINTESAQPDAFSEEDERLLVTVAGQVATAIEKVRLFEAERRRRREAETLREATAALTSALNPAQILDDILVCLEQVIPYHSAAVLLLREEKLRVMAVRGVANIDHMVGYEFPATNVFFQQLTRTRQPLYLADAQADPRFERWEGLGHIRGWLAAPLIVRGEVNGYLTLDSQDVDTYGAAEAALARAFANQASVALENARLFAEAQRRAEELADALARQEELDRLKVEFIQNASHELRTPLAILRGYAELLDVGELGQLQPKQREAMTIIARRSRMLTKLLEDFTAILATETQEIKKEPVNLVDLVQTLTTDFRAAVQEAQLTLAVDIAPHLPRVLGDPTHLHRVLDNLLGNARKFTPAGGTITVRLSQDGPDVVLEVADSGVGIPSDQLDRIFERFYPVHGSMSRRYGGSGLGLALVKEIVEAHGGRVTVKSVVGEGSVFIVRLPYKK